MYSPLPRKDHKFFSKFWIMAKKSLFSAIFIAFSLFCNLSINGAEYPFALPQAESCDAPAPDSFRITSVGGHFISLKWKPVAGINAYFMLVSLQDSTGGWIPNQVFPNIPDTLITVNGLEGGKKYQFKISSKCPNGDISGLTSIIDGVTLIVDLTVGGRIPQNPLPINGIGIDYQKLPWLGFRVSGEGASGLFEVNVNDASFQPVAWIRRVYLTDKIVAVDDQGNFPIPGIPIIENVEIPFAIWNNLPEAELIGKVEIMKHQNFPGPPTVDILIADTDPDWKSQYTLTVLSAQGSIINPSGGGSGGTGQGLSSNNETRFVSAESPFAGHLDLKINNSGVQENNIPFFIFDGSGQLKSTGLFGPSDTHYRIEAQNWPDGVYYLICNNGHERSVLKIVKAGF
jgi:hypothetical protein